MEKKKYNAPKVKIVVMEKLMVGSNSGGGEWGAKPSSVDLNDTQNVSDESTTTKEESKW